MGHLPAPAVQSGHKLRESSSEREPLSTGLYDVGIWEEIRSRVARDKVQLLENINAEILKDASLADFQGKNPVPFQLKEITAIRANAWVQRLYDLCSDAYMNDGKSLSVEFDRAVWAYCIEPFIICETESQVHDPRMNGFLNLLLCVVGSPPESRSSLKVSQKEACFEVRGGPMKCGVPRFTI